MGFDSDAQADITGNDERARQALDPAAPTLAQSSAFTAAPKGFHRSSPRVHTCLDRSACENTADSQRSATAAANTVDWWGRVRWLPQLQSTRDRPRPPSSPALQGAQTLWVAAGPEGQQKQGVVAESSHHIK